jgi:hypothetical protein
MIIEGKVGPNTGADGVLGPARLARTGALVVADGHARFFEAAIRGALFAGGMTLTSINNATFSTGTLTATATPIAGVWNPLNSGKNLVILQARIAPVNTALQATGAGALMWASSLGNGAISTGNSPFNRGTGVASGSVAKDMSGVALTGLTNNLVVRDATALGSGVISNLSTLQTAAGLFPPMLPSIDHVDGAFVVPPGGVLAILCTTNPPVAISAASSLIWEEVPILS